MRVQHNISAMNANRNLTANNSKLSKNLEKLSSGYRINRAGDDAAGLAISESMRRSIASYDQGINNANDGISLIQTAEGALTEVHDMLNRAQTLLTQKSNGTLNDDQTGNIEDELKQLASETARILDNTKFNDISVLDNDTLKDISINMGDAGSITLEKVEDQAWSSALLTGLNGEESDWSSIAQDDLENAIQDVSNLRSVLGAYQNRLEHSVNSMGVTRENLQNAEATIRDTNIADEMMEYTTNNILVQSAQAMLAQANQVPQGVLQLMQ